MGAAPLLTTFGIIFLAELGDKTTYTVLLLATRHRALPVLLGAWAAFLGQSLIAMAMGSLLERLPVLWVQAVTVAVFASFGLVLLFKKEDNETATSDDKPARGVFFTTLSLVFLAEWGDATQIGTAALVARFHRPLQVFIGATLGLWMGTVVAIVVGKLVGHRIPSHLLRRGAGIVFCAFAVLTTWGMLHARG